MKPESTKRIATTIGISLFAFYIAWNAWWLSLGKIPPSIFFAATGIPSPTTGGTRSFIALTEGNFVQSLYFNVATIPIVVLFIATLWFVIRRGSAPQYFGKLWTRLLLFAFAAKLVAHAIN